MSLWPPSCPHFRGCWRLVIIHLGPFDVGGYQCFTETNRRTQRRLSPVDFRETRINRWRNPVAPKKKVWMNPRRPCRQSTKKTNHQRYPYYRGSSYIAATYFTHVDSVVSFFSDSIYHVFYPVGFRCEVSGLEWREIVWDCCKCFEVSWAMTWLW